ncbi:hypothetical protein NLJ89_g408 [Agrocybe chaxingu]|uniref:Uncharacterized protein n=1 Tax=Agrocybe chaxingu TaxID=84603 RepID=A0A9W8TGI5_9AGAR|nr:hypothetical protein NLJ89_g408 [Agrocybe chaxingu]
MQNNNFNNQFNPVDAPGAQGYPYGVWTTPLPGRVAPMASQMQMPPQQAVPSMALIESGTRKRRADEPLARV